MLPRRPAPAAVGGLAGSDAAAGLGALVVDAVVIGDGEDIPGSDSEPGSAIWDVQPPSPARRAELKAAAATRAPAAARTSHRDATPVASAVLTGPSVCRIVVPSHRAIVRFPIA